MSLKEQIHSRLGLSSRKTAESVNKSTQNATKRPNSSITPSHKEKAANSASAKKSKYNLIDNVMKKTKEPELESPREDEDGYHQDQNGPFYHHKPHQASRPFTAHQLSCFPDPKPQKPPSERPKGETPNPKPQPPPPLAGKADPNTETQQRLALTLQNEPFGERFGDGEQQPVDGVVECSGPSPHAAAAGREQSDQPVPK